MGCFSFLTTNEIAPGFLQVAPYGVWVCFSVGECQPHLYNIKAPYHLFLGFIHARDCKVSLSRMDDFYESSPSSRGSLLPSIHPLSSHLSLVFAILLAACAIVLATRFLSERVSEKLNDKQERTVWLLPYWVPVIGHAFSL